MIKVLFLIHSLGHGGAEKVLVSLVNNLDRERFDVTVQTIIDGGVNQKFLAPWVHYVPGWREFYGNSFVVRIIPASILWRWLIKDKYDIAVAYLEGTATKLLSGCQNAALCKIAWIHIEMQKRKQVSKCFISFAEAYRAYCGFDQLVFVSNTVKETFFEVTGLSGKNTQVIYNTVDVEDILKKSLEIVNNDDFKSEQFRLCSVGKLTPTKGYDRLITVVSRLYAEGKTIHLFLLGEGEMLDKLREQAEDLGITHIVTFLGYQENPYCFVRNCNLYVCSSFREGYSTAVTEALIVGTPVVSTNCSGAKELLGDSEYGIVTENTTEGIYQGIKQMIDDNDLYQYYRLKAKERGTQFNSKATTACVEQMLETVLNKKEHKCID